MLFRVSVWNDPIECTEEHDLAWVVWHENFGTSATDTRVHYDPSFPDVLRRHFPRLYVPEHRDGASYDVIPVRNIIAPAPLSDDVSLIHVGVSKQKSQMSRTSGNRLRRGDQARVHNLSPTVCPGCIHTVF